MFRAYEFWMRQPTSWAAWKCWSVLWHCELAAGRRIPEHRSLRCDIRRSITCSNWCSCGHSSSATSHQSGRRSDTGNLDLQTASRVERWDSSAGLAASFLQQTNPESGYATGFIPVETGLCITRIPISDVTCVVQRPVNHRGKPGGERRRWDLFWGCCRSIACCLWVTSHCCEESLRTSFSEKIAPRDPGKN